MFWEALEGSPSLRGYLVDIVQTSTWGERALRWGFSDGEAAQHFAESVLGDWLTELQDGTVLNLLLEATGR